MWKYVENLISGMEPQLPVVYRFFFFFRIIFYSVIPAVIDVFMIIIVNTH